MSFLRRHQSVLLPGIVLMVHRLLCLPLRVENAKRKSKKENTTEQGMNVPRISIRLAVRAKCAAWYPFLAALCYFYFNWNGNKHRQLNDDNAHLTRYGNINTVGICECGTYRKRRLSSFLHRCCYWFNWKCLAAWNVKLRSIKKATQMWRQCTDANLFMETNASIERQTRTEREK